MQKNYPFQSSVVKGLPDAPGVYVFKDNYGVILYIGKAKNLKKRVVSYLSAKVYGKTKNMVGLAKTVSYIKVNSELEALILEANLIRKHQPKYNFALKDDKSQLYIAITAAEFPRVLAVRKTQLSELALKYTFGPLSHAANAKSLLRVIRRIFPFATHTPGPKICLYAQLGLCAPCPSFITAQTGTKRAKLKRQYLKNVANIIQLLSGRIGIARRQLIAEIAKLSKREEFEEAGELRDRLKIFERLVSPPVDTMDYVRDPNFLTDMRLREERQLRKLINPHIKVGKLSRIECFDIAHLAGTFPTASMVTFVAGEPDKSFYRRFKIYTKLAGDTDRMAEVVKRRVKHFADWGVPDLIIVDGGKPQVASAARELATLVPLIGLAKRFETIVVKTASGFSEIRLYPSPALNLLQRIRDESHRFARVYHHKLVARHLTGK